MADDIKPAYQGEMMLAGWKDSHTSGPIVSFWLPDAETLEVFKGMTAKKGNVAGQRFMAVLVELNDDDTPAGQDKRPKPTKENRPPNELARKLHVSGYFMAPALWDAVESAGIYTQDDHDEWLRSFGECEAVARTEHQGPLVIHHVKHVAAELGDPDHPQKVKKWWCVPLCQHHHNNWVHGTGLNVASRADREGLKAIALELTAERMKDKMKEFLGIDTLRDLTPERWRTWCDTIAFEWRT